MTFPFLVSEPLRERIPIMASPFSVRLSAVLKSRGMSQTDLAAASGLTPSTVNRYVNGGRVPSIEVAERICAALGVGPEVFAESLSAFSAKQLAGFCRENAPYYTADQKLEIVKALLG